MAECPAGRVNEPHLSLHLQFRHFDFVEGAVRDVLLDAHFREKSDAFIALDHQANRFHCWHLDFHVELHFVALKLLQHDVAIW